MLPSGEVVEEAFAVVYNGGVIDPEQAQLIDVRAGATSTGIDIPMAAGRLRSHHIRGVVWDAGGKPASGASVTAIPRRIAADVLILRGVADGTGAFDLEGAVPGSYSIFVSTTTQPIGPPQPNAPASAGSPPATAELGYAVVDTSNSDLENVRITTPPGWTLPARVVIEGHPLSNDPDMGRIRIGVNRDPDIVGAPPGLMTLPPLPRGTPANSRLANGQPDGSGAANLLIAPGDYRLTLGGFPANAYVKAVRMAGIDVWNNGLHLISAPENPLEIVFGTDAGEVTGILINDKKELVKNAVVALVPESPVIRLRPTAFRNGLSDMDGKFRIGAVPPGRYIAFAWEYADAGSWQDAEFLRPYEFAGTLIEVRENGKVETQLTVLPRR